MGKRKTTEQFISEARKVHGDKYDYSMVEYVNARTKVCIVCPEHGEFWQIPDSHLRGRGCWKCGRAVSGEKQRQWTKDSCYEVAMRCKTVEEFREKFPAAYVVSSKRGWRKDYVWLSLKQMPNGYWNNYDLCKEAASKCKNVSEFIKQFSNAHLYSVQNKWIDDFFPNRQKKVHWTDDLVMEEAKKYASKVEFKRNNQTAYNYVCKHGLIEKCVWFKVPKKDNSSLVLDYIGRCIKKYGGYYDYSLIDVNHVKDTSHAKVPIVCPEHGVFYQNLWRHLNCVCPCDKCRRGIHGKRTDGIKTIIEDSNEHGVIYCYTDKQNGKKYIGQTIRCERRKKDHLRKNKKYNTTFDKIFQNKGEENFTYEILFEVDEKRSKIFNILNEKEKEFIKKYNCQVPNGYNISEGGGSVTWMNGYKPTEETLQKLRDSHKGKPSLMKGKHLSLEEKNKRVKKRRGTMAKKYKEGYVVARKPIVVYKINNDNFENIGTFPNAKEIERRIGVDNKRIHCALKKRAPLDDLYIFIYENEDKSQIVEMSRKKSLKKQERKFVKQFNANGEVEAILSLSEATKKFGRHVSECCNNKRDSCNGYKFEWAKSQETIGEDAPDGV